MKNNGKRLSNPFSTGDGGGYFEARVQASFVVLMLTGGYAPCMPIWPISKIQLQGKFAGYDTDDLIVFVEKEGSGNQRKILCQIKHSIGITENNKVFQEVIQASWNDFNNSDLFSRGKDAFVLITGLLSATDINDARSILEWARHSVNVEEFLKKVELAHFSSQRKRDKLSAFRTNLKKANGGNPVSDEMLFEFLKHFHLLGYDLDIKAGVTLSLLQSLIGQYSSENAASWWTRIVDEVQSANKNAGIITIDSLPDDLRTVFTQRSFAVIPKDLSIVNLSSISPDWNQLSFASELSFVNLIGEWDENNEADKEIIHKLVNEDYNSWIVKIREALQLPKSPITLKNGRWRVTERAELWKALGQRFFDNILDRFKLCAISVLTEHDPQFDLPPGERFTANIHGKILKYSPEMRKGISEGLALLSTKSSILTNCSQNKPELIAILSVREIFENSDWKLWSSLNNLLPTLAEADPNELLKAIEDAMCQTPCPFDELFSQEGIGIFGGNYLTGLLWALETLAWEESYFVRVCVILGELAMHDPGGNWANRPANSLTMILLPWFPRTMASIDKRKAAVQNLQKEFPKVAWTLLLSLLPNKHQVSSGTHKPSWRNPIPDDCGKSVSPSEYWEQISFYSEMVVSIADHDLEKLNELVSHLDNLPQPSFEKVLEHLSSEIVTNKPEDQRLKLWTSLTVFTSKHRHFSNTDWALKNDILSKIESVSVKLAPHNPMNLYRRLFSYHDLGFIEETGNWQEQEKKLKISRQEAVKQILNTHGLNGVIQFAELVESPYEVGYSLGINAQLKIDAIILPSKLESENQKLLQFSNGYVLSRQFELGWTWVDSFDKLTWSVNQISQFLSNLPFTGETWNRAAKWLGNSEREYWVKARVNPHQAHCDLGLAIDKLIDFGRPNAALNCLYKAFYDKNPLDKPRSIKALLTSVSSIESSNSMDTYHVIEIIKALQGDPLIDQEDLFQVEWAYLPLLDRHSGASPILLENRLASNSSFFCEAIRIMYRSIREIKTENEPSKVEKAVATNVWRLLHDWRTPPGIQPDGTFSSNKFKEWLEKVRKECSESGHLEVALTHVGKVLIYTPPDPQGLWIDRNIAEVLNERVNDEMRKGFYVAIFNSRGAHFVDPSGTPERELALQYRQKAEEVENSGYQRFAVTLKSIADSYEKEAERNSTDLDNP